MVHDVVIVGGSFAGLAAATYLGRARRNVCVIDAGQPRNRFADVSHGFLGSDGSEPRQILASARDQLKAYPTVLTISGEVLSASLAKDGFSMTLKGGERISARKAIFAFGLNDRLEPIPGLQQRWGKSVLHCPYCHGFEFSDRELGVLYRVPMSVHQASLISEWGPTTLFMNGAELQDEESRETLARRGIRVEARKIERLFGNGTTLSGLDLEDGRSVSLDALYVAPQSCLSSPLAAQLGAIIDEGPMGPIVRTDADKMTSVPGLYAAGDIARAPHSVSWAVADGVTAGTSAHRALVFG